MGYAAGNGERMGIVLEIRQGMVDRGADISWLSQVPVHLCCTCMHAALCDLHPCSRATPLLLAQYPHESENLFGPLTGIEVLGTRIDCTVVVIECSFSVNLNALTIEQVIGKMQMGYVSLVSTMLGELKHCSAPPKALAPLQAVLDNAKRRGHAFFNVRASALPSLPHEGRPVSLLMPL